MTQGGHFAGEVVGTKTLKEYLGRNAYGHHVWTAVCNSCGAVTRPDSISHLKRHAHCAVCQRLPANNGRWLGYKEISGSWLWTYREGAKKRGHVWQVTPEYLWDLFTAQNRKCRYTGITLVHGIDASLDRIDSGQGYIEGNVQWVHKDINLMKNVLSEERFLFLCQLVSENTPHE